MEASTERATRDTSGAGTPDRTQTVSGPGLLTPEQTPEPHFGQEPGGDAPGDGLGSDDTGSELAYSEQANQPTHIGAERPTPAPVAPKRKYVRKIWGPATRSSKRHKREDPDTDGAAGGIVGFTAQIFDSEQIQIPEQEA